MNEKIIEPTKTLGYIILSGKSSNKADEKNVFCEEELMPSQIDDQKIAHQAEIQNNNLHD